MGRHQSLDSHCKQSLAWIKTIPSVTKIVIGISESCRHRYPPGYIRFRMDVSGGIKVNAYSGNGISDIFIKIDPIEDREKVKMMIKTKYSR